MASYKDIFEENDYLKETIDYLTINLSGYIDPYHLECIITDVFANENFKPILNDRNCYPSAKGDNTFNDEVITDVAYNGAIAHWYLSTPLGDFVNRCNMLNDKTYMQRVEEIVIQNCKLRQLLNQQQRIGGMNHIPIVYIMQCLTELLFSKVKSESRIIKYFKKSKVFAYNSFYKMITTMKSLITISVDSDIYNAYSLLRTLIESMFVYLALFDNDSGIKAYNEFLHYRVEYEENNNDFTDDFLNVCPKGVSKINYLDYGWLDAIDPSNTSYSFESVFRHSQIKEATKDDFWLKTYKQCSKFVHGNLYGFANYIAELYHLMHYASQLLVNIANLYDYVFGENCVCEDIDLVECLSSRIEELNKIMKHMPQFKEIEK